MMTAQISGIVPQSPVADLQAQPVFVTGSGFLPGLSVSLAGAGGTTTLSGNSISLVSSSSFQLLAPLSTVGSYTVVAANPNEVGSNPFSFRAQSPRPPRITSIIPPTPSANTTVQVLQLTGVDLSDATSATLTPPGGTPVSVPFTVSTPALARVTVPLPSPGSYTITITTLGGPSNAFPFTVAAPPVPRITSISSSVPAANAALQIFSLNGSNFQVGMTVTLTDPNNQSIQATVGSVAPTSAQVRAILAAVGSYGIQASIPNAGPSNLFTFQVQAPPEIQSISPASPFSGSAAQSLQVAGTGFGAGLTVALTAPSSAPIPVVRNVTASTFDLDVTLPVGGAYQLRVTNPGGGVGNAFRFTVQASPSITSISPASPAADAAAQAVQVTGSGFGSSPTATLAGPSGPVAVQVSSVTATGLVLSAVLADPGPYTLGVANSGGGQPASFPFTVQPSPAITSIDPTTPRAKPTPTTIELNGSGFQDGLSLTVTNPRGSVIPITGNLIRSVTAIRIRFDVELDLPGSWTVQVNNPVGRSNVFPFTVQ